MLTTSADGSHRNKCFYYSVLVYSDRNVRKRCDSLIEIENRGNRDRMKNIKHGNCKRLHDLFMTPFHAFYSKTYQSIV